MTEELRLDKDSLEHYGILGMKWGVRNDPGKGGRKAASKSRRVAYSPAEKKVISSSEKEITSLVKKYGVRETTERTPTLAERDTRTIMLTIRKSRNASEATALQLALEDHYDAYAASVEHSDLQDSLEHYGILGMKWGVRNDPGKGGRAARKEAKSTERRNIIEQKILRSPRLLRKNLDMFSQAEIDAAVKRMRLDRELRNLTTDKIKAGTAYSDALMSYVKTAQAIYGLAESPLGQAFRKRLRKQNPADWV